MMIFFAVLEVLASETDHVMWSLYTQTWMCLITKQKFNYGGIIGIASAMTYVYSCHQVE